MTRQKTTRRNTVQDRPESGPGAPHPPSRAAALRRWLPVALVVLLIAAAWASGLGDLVNFEAVKARRGDLQALAAAHPLAGPVAFAAAYAAAVALSLPVATVLTLLGGFLFGPWLGTLAVVGGATAGASAVFLIARSALGATLREKAGPLYAKIAAEMTRNAAGYMLFMRLVPLFPFFVVNIVPALFEVRLGVYVLTTFFGILPGTFVYVNAGRALGTLESAGDLVAPQTLGAFALLGVFALVPMLYRRFAAARRRPTGSDGIPRPH